LRIKSSPDLFTSFPFPNQTLERLMGGELDATKIISSLTLFEAAGLSGATTLLNHLGHRCAWTQTQLNPQN
jgi:uncharacterized protein (DUF1810 family)